MTVYLFPGQGSQYKGMGEALFDRFPEHVTKADAILGYSIETLCLHDPQQQLNQTFYTQPALYTVNALSYLDKLQNNLQPQYVAGHSLGEYNALLAANVFDFETGLQLVKKRAELMQQATGGGMAAIIGLSAEKIQTILQTEGFSNIDIANYNAPNQIVISGPKTDIEQAQPSFEKSGAMMVIPLKVSGAFHSRYMQESQEKFSRFLQQFSFNPPQISVIANISGKPYQPDEITHNLAQQLTHSVRWADTIRYLKSMDEQDFREVGPGRVLTGLLKHNR